MKPKIILTSEAEHFAEKLKAAGFEIILASKNKDSKRLFPDSEVYVRLPEVAALKGKVTVLHTGAPNPNNGLVELEMVLELLKGRGLIIEVFFTYFPYGMQDAEFEVGEINAAEKLIAKLVGYYGVNKIYAIDAHFQGRDWIKKYPFANVSAHDLIMMAVKKDYPEVLPVAPDLGHERRTNLRGFKKTRTDSYNVTIHHDEEFLKTLKGKTIAVVDDLVETGGTMVNFAETCQKHGVTTLVAAVTHGVLQSGIERLKAKYQKLYLTNTINRAEANIEVAGLIAEAINTN